MLFGLLKRAFFAVEERDADDTAPAVNEATLINSQTAWASGSVDKTGDEQTKAKREMRVKLKESEETTRLVKKEAERDLAIIKKLTEDTMTCMVCQEIIQNPQSLQCGHSACYSCLRKWWTQPLPQTDNVELIDTVAESDLDDEVVEPNAGPEPRLRRRHVFRSAVKREKSCPYCNTRVSSRPVPDLRTRDIVGTLNGDLAPVPAHVQARREARLTRRRDIWHGIFPPVPVEKPVVIPAPVAPPPHPDPILNHIAQAQFRRAAEEAVALRAREREQWFLDGRRMGILQTTQQLAREERARRAAISRPVQGQALERGHALLPPPGQGVGAGQGDALLVVFHGPPAPPADAQQPM